MREQINAKWANEQATKVLGEKINKQLSACLDNIEQAVKANKMTCGVSIYAENLTIAELRKRGFNVKQEDTQRDGTWLTISW